MEKKGENFEAHLKQVNGVPVPAGDEEIAAKRQEWREKVALKKVQIDNYKNKDDPSEAAKKNDIKKLQTLIDNICPDILTLSKTYDDKVFAEGKSKHNAWIVNLMDYASAILIADDKITIQKALLVKLEKQFEEEVQKTIEKVKEENTKEQNRCNALIAVNEQKVALHQAELVAYTGEADQKIKEALLQKATTDKALTNNNLVDDARLDLLKQQKEISENISFLQKNSINNINILKGKISLLEEENQKLKEEVGLLIAGLYKKQQEEVAKIKILFDTKKNTVNQLIITGKTILASARKEYTEKANFYEKENTKYIDIIAKEAARILSVSQETGCTVWNETRGKVVTNWNKLFPCVNNITTLAKPYSSNVFNAYCSGTSSSAYLTSYKSFLSSINTDEKSAIKANSNADWFNLITK
jgi:hypothetical protein